MLENLEKAWDKISEKAIIWGEQGIDMLPNLLVAILVFIGFLLLSKFITKVISKKIEKVSKNEAVNGLLVSIVKILIVAIGLLTCLGILHLDKAVASILAGVGLFGLAFSFAFQHTAHNLLSGIVIATKSTINVGHMVEINGTVGVVTRIGLRATYVENTEGQIVAVPNRLVTDENYMDFSVLGERRVDIIGHIAYGSNLELAEQTTINAIKRLEGLKKDRSIEFYYTDMADFSVQFVVRFWLKFNNVHPEYLNIKHKAIVHIMSDFEKADIEIPFPTTVVKGIGNI